MAAAMAQATLATKVQSLARELAHAAGAAGNKKGRAHSFAPESWQDRQI